MKHPLLLAAAALMAAAPGSAQSLADRIAAVRDGVVRMSFASRPEVCSDGNGSTWTRGSYDGYRNCIHGPVRVALGHADGHTVSVRTRVGGSWGAPASSEVDLGEVSSKDAARYLVALVHSMAGRNADDALSAAVFADDVDLAPSLREIVVDDSAPLESRKSALFWLGQSDFPTRDLNTLYDRLTPSLREQFTFVVSQRRDDESLNKLFDIAQHDRDTQIRKQAMFWLSQSKDPRVTKFFRDILTP